MLIKMIKLYILIFCISFLPVAQGFVSGQFFWKPRLALDLAVPSTSSPFGVARMPHKDDIYAGLITLVDGYAAGMTIISIASGIASSRTVPYLNPLSAYYYTQAYRWGLRYFSLLPQWVGGGGGHFVLTHKTWKRRFYFMDEFLPKWMQKILAFVKEEEWEKEYTEWKRFKKYSEPAFGKHYRYPRKVFNFFKSQETVETAELNYQEISSAE